MKLPGSIEINKPKFIQKVVLTYILQAITGLQIFILYQAVDAIYEYKNTKNLVAQKRGLPFLLTGTSVPNLQNFIYFSSS